LDLLVPKSYEVLPRSFKDSCLQTGYFQNQLFAKSIEVVKEFRLKTPKETKRFPSVTLTGVFSPGNILDPF
jgi:hypothetical protein